MVNSLLGGCLDPLNHAKTHFMPVIQLTISSCRQCPFVSFAHGTRSGRTVDILKCTKVEKIKLVYMGISIDDFTGCPSWCPILVQDEAKDISSHDENNLP